uniref:PRA1 family protein n=1 Tax=Kalanchoe fedtschenkoi TaxID=63787 RepID=A0A7N0T6P7_KALFE
MASSAPTILPISNTQPAVPQSEAPIATPAFRLFLNHISDTVRNGLSQRRPWAELADRNAFSKPESITEAAGRIKKNYTYFRINYLTVIAAVLGISLVTNPFSLLTLVGLLAAWLFLYLFRPSDPPLVILGRTFSERETLGLLSVLSIVVVFLTSVGSLLISALLVGAGIVCAHGAFRVPEDLFLDEPEPAAAGFLSFLGGGSAAGGGTGRI